MRKIVNFRPIVIGGICSVLGVIMAATFCRLSVIIVFIPIIIGAIVAFTAFLFNKNASILFYSIAFILLYTVSALRISVYVGQNVSAATFDKEVTFSGEVTDVLSYDEDKDISRVILKNVTADNIDFHGGNVLVSVSGGSEVGDTFSVTAEITKIEFETVDTFYFPRGVFYKSSRVLKTEKLSTGGGMFYVFRVGIKRIMRSNLSERSNGFVSSLILGDAGGIDEESYSNFQAAGVAHIFAVSGLHIGFLAALISFLLNLLNVRRLKNALIVLLITTIYAGICGFSVSSIRAVVTCFIYGVARSFGAKRDNLNAVFLSLIIVLSTYPSSLFSFGFLLSFSAVIGISCMRNNFISLFSFMNEKVAGLFAVALSAFLSTAPIVATFSGSVSLITVLANVLLLPITSLIYYIAIISLIIVAIFPVFGFIFRLTEILSVFTTDVMSLIDFERFLLYGNVTVVNLIFYYLALFFSCEKVNLPDKLKRIIGASASLSLLLFV